MKPARLALLAIAFSFALGSTAQAAAIMFGSTADFEPYNYLDDEGELQGFEAELATILCERANLTCDWALAPWEDMMGELLSSEFDVIMTGMQITEEREAIIDFTEEYFPADPSAIMVMDGGAAPSAFMVVGAQTDTLQAEYITEQGWSLASYASPADAVQALLDGEIGAYVADQSYLGQVIAANDGVFSLVTTDLVIGGGIGIGVRPSSPGLLVSLNTAIASVKADGTLDTLIATWFSGRDPNYRGAE
jgi:polar amino acid transport system substrate-binding protein